MISTRKYWGVSLLILAFSFSANAQTCKPIPDCVSMGYTNIESECAESVKCPFDTSKVACVKELPPSCEIGSILYFDKSCDKIVVAGKTAIGVVFDKDKKLAIALERSPSKLAWGGNNKDTGMAHCYTMPCAIDGKENTQIILNYGKKNGISYPAAEYCNTYKTAGTQAGDWFFPSFIELQAVVASRTQINSSLVLLGKSILSDYHWSSNETHSSGCYYISLNDGGFGNVLSKTSLASVLPVLKY